MRHRRAVAHLNREIGHRGLMLSNLVRSLILHDRIETTLTRARELRRWAERMITFGKGGSLNDRRQALKFITDKDAVKKVFDVLAEKYKDRSGGYTRIVKVGPRRGDAAEMAIVEFV